VDEVLNQHTARLVALEQGQIELKQGVVELRQGVVELGQGQDELKGGLVDLRQDLKLGLADVKGGQGALIDLLTKIFERPKTAE
jgi:hypothetical protein